MTDPRAGGWLSVEDVHGDVRRVLWWVLFANVAVIVAKLVIGIRSGSIAILGDAAHSGIDAVNNVVGLLAVRLAARPPDALHPYGHTKFETVAAFAVAAFLSVTCFELVETAVRRLATGAPPPRIANLTLGVLAGTMVVNGLVAASESRAARRLNSAILAADARHTAADIWVTAGVLGGMILTRATGWARADAILAILVAVVVARAGYEILRETIPVLVDERAFDPERIRRLVLRHAGVIEVDQIRSRGRPGEAFAELTIQVDPSQDVVSAHEIADRVEKELESEGFLGVVVHVEPYLLDDRAE